MNGVRDTLLATGVAVSTTAGDLTYATGANALARLPIGSTGQVLTVSAGLPTWGAVPSTFTSLTVGAGTYFPTTGAVRMPVENFVYSRDNSNGDDVRMLGLTTDTRALVTVGPRTADSTASWGVLVERSLGIGNNQAGSGGTIPLYINKSSTAAANNSQMGIYVICPFTRTGANSGDVCTELYTYPTVIVNAGVTLTRHASLWLAGGGNTVNGTLTNNNMIYLENPNGGSTQRVIDSAAGAYLTTGGIWTNNPSWAALKDGIRPVDAGEVARLLDWMRTDYQPVRYRYRTEDGPRDQGYEFEHFGFLLDDMPEDVRAIVCADPAGGISTKDTEGFLLALVKGLAVEVAELRAKVMR